jgi:hypothetical protein
MPKRTSSVKLFASLTFYLTQSFSQFAENPAKKKWGRNGVREMGSGLNYLLSR